MHHPAQPGHAASCQQAFRAATCGGSSRPGWLRGRGCCCCSPTPSRPSAPGRSRSRHHISNHRYVSTCSTMREVQNSTQAQAHSLALPSPPSSVHTLARTHTHAPAPAPAPAPAHTHTHTHTHTPCTRAHTHTHTMHARTRARAHTHTHIYTHEIACKCTRVAGRARGSARKLTTFQGPPFMLAGEWRKKWPLGSTPAHEGTRRHQSEHATPQRRARETCAQRQASGHRAGQLRSAAAAAVQTETAAGWSPTLTQRMRNPDARAARRPPPPGGRKRQRGGGAPPPGGRKRRKPTNATCSSEGTHSDLSLEKNNFFLNFF